MKEWSIEAAWMAIGVFRYAEHEYANGIGPTSSGENRFVNAKQHYGMLSSREVFGLVVEIVDGWSGRKT